MAREQRAEFWAAVVAEAQAGGASHAEIAAKHGVTEAALKYHFYKARRSGKRPAVPRVLPVRVKGESPSALIEAEFRGVRVSFREGCEPAYIAAVLGALGKC